MVQQDESKAKGVYRYMSVNPEAEREENDYYATDPKAIEVALPYLKEVGLCENVWECSCGEGHISKTLVKNGYSVRSSDLIDRGYGEVLDFLTCENKYHGDILTNPPFKFAESFVRKGLDLINDGNKIFLFLKIQFLEGIARYKLFQEFPPKYILVYSERQKTAKNGEFETYGNNGSTVCYAWFVWERGCTTEPIVRWIKDGEKL